MSYQVRVNALSLGHALRDAALYVGKNAAWEATAHILLIMLPKQKKLAVIGCDGNGYYERRLALVQEKGAPKPAFPGKDKAVLLGAQEAALLVKFCKSKSIATLTVTEEEAQGYRLSVGFPDGSSTSVACPANLEVPAYDQITSNAAKGEKQAMTPANVCIPVRELGRASKVFPVAAGRPSPCPLPGGRKRVASPSSNTSPMQTTRTSASSLSSAFPKPKPPKKEKPMNTTLHSDIRILDNLLAVNLDISLWSARKKMTPEDLGGAELPPEDLASLGSKRVADPERLRVFSTLKSRAFNFLDRHGVRFMSGWAIPEEKAGDIVAELIRIRDEFRAAKEDFLAGYGPALQAWIDKHRQWGAIIRNSVVSSDYVRSRLTFRWQFFKVAPLESHSDENAVLEAGLADEVTGLGGTLFSEVAKSAQEIWRRVYMGKTEVTHKALSPLRTLHGKLVGLSFVEPHVAPVADIIKAVLGRMPAKGTITGTDLLLLQGLVCLLGESEALVLHAQKLIEGYGPATVLDALLAGGQTAPSISVAESAGIDGQEEHQTEGREAEASTDLEDDAEPNLPELPVPANGMGIQSLGLW